MSESSIVKYKPIKSGKYLLVRYSKMAFLGWFEHHENYVPGPSGRVVVKTDRGLELGYMVGQPYSYKSGHFKLSMDQVKKYFDDSGITFPSEPTGQVVRYADDNDISEERHLGQIAKEEMEFCRKCVKEMKLPMNIVEVDHVFGGERIIFYFLAEERVDFRQLVKKLAHEYQTRIEMRQIGARDEAKILGDVESCGQQCCCQRFLKTLNPVNMRMAKMQKATLDPAKISGYCGRLKCCLRYEDMVYKELKANLPNRNSMVKTENGVGRVINTQILTQLVVIEYENGERATVGVNDIEIVGRLREKKEQKQTVENGNDNKVENIAEEDIEEQDSEENNDTENSYSTDEE